MGSGDWFKTIISRKKTKQDRLKHTKGSANERSNGFKLKNHSYKELHKFYNGASSGRPGDAGMTIEDTAAIQIQTAFRRFKARKSLRSLKGIQRLQVLAQGDSVKKHASTTLSYIQIWSKMQAEIRARRASMVTESRNRQKKKENQMKLEAKLHDLEVEWCGGSETMEEILTRIQQREEAAVKRERAMAYAFSHQWRASSGLNQGYFAYEFGRGNWGWSWVDRWVAARPWETRLPAKSISPGKAHKKAGRKDGKNTSASVQRLSNSGKHPATADGKSSAKRSPQPKQEDTASQETKSMPAPSPHAKAKNGQLKQEQHLSSQTIEIAG